MDNDKSILLNSNILCTEPTIECSSWPDYPASSSSCTDDGYGYKLLDENLKFSQTAKCESLCKQQHETGCCYLCLDGCGCWWIRGAKGVKNESTGEQVAVKCNIKFAGDYG